MASTTNPDFGANTEATEVAKAFTDGIRGKTVLITGVNRGGIGFATAQAFSPAHVILAGRSASKAKESIDELKAEFPDVDYRFLEVDLSSQASVRNAAKEFLSWSDIPAIDLIINSAGVMAVQERTLSKDGIEMHLATNHIGHWLLSCLLMPKLIKASEGKPKGSVRIVNVTSASPMVSNMRWSDMNFDKKNKDLPQEEQPNYEFFKLWGYKNCEETSYVPLDGYNRSKVANVLFGIEANKRLFEKHGILTLAAHPGVIMTTELGRNFPKETLKAAKKLGSMGFYTHKSLEAGASTSLVAALDPKLANGIGETHEGSDNYGAYLADCQISTGAKPLAVSSSEAKKLWDFSEEATGQKFSWGCEAAIREDKNPDTFSDADSTISQPVTDSLASLRSSVLQHQIENGQYAYPNDQSENERLEIQHNVWLLTLRGSLALCPKGNEAAKRVLDVGTGTGCWAIEYSHWRGSEPNSADYVSYQFSGTAESDKQRVPINCTFEIDDLEKDWAWAKPFDFVFSRVMAGSFEDYDAFISKAYKALEPGGWFEMQDIVLPYKSDDGTLHADLELAKLGHYVCEASKILGRSVEAPRHYKSMMQKAGFINIVERHFKWPLNAWAKDPYYKEIGAWSFANLDGGLEGLTLALFTRGMKWTKEETMTFCAEVRKHLRDPRIHAYLPV
ncbi:hypothetical protein BFJ70_g2384 [Fusarium oxysporum]|nr:hypothetical protein BFJ70_g2384 [Fusarium oxysporum]